MSSFQGIGIEGLLYTEVSSFQGIGIEGLLYIEVSSFQGIEIEELHCIIYFRGFIWRDYHCNFLFS